MKVRDESLWQLQCSELEQSGETGQHFLKFLRAWMEETERLLAGPGNHISPTEALRTAFSVTEQQQHRCGSYFFAQMLVLIATHWVRGDEAMNGLTVFEQHLVQDAVAIKVAEMQKMAEMAQGGSADE